jgi:hypothetical protein
LTDITTSVHQLTTVDRASVAGVLRVPDGATTAVTIMHPRSDVTHHASVPYLLRSGYAVWTQGSRSPNNDLNLLHEQALLDFAAGHVHLRDLGFERVVSLGHSGGATLAAFYCQQAARTPGERLPTTPTGRSVPLADAELPLPDGCVFMAPHPGQGALLQRVIDPSVTDESDPGSVDPELDPFDARNGFADGPSTYSADFVTAYRAAQARRVERIDERALRWLEEGGPPRILTTYRTDADLRNLDLTLDPNQRPYGSLWGPRPDRTNYGLVGFGRLATAEAWLSTWSANHTRADFARCAPEVTVPSLLLELTGDQGSYPADIARYAELLGANDVTVASVPGTHFGGPIAKGEPTGTELAAVVMENWIDSRFA